MQPSDKRAKLKKATISRCRMFLKAYLFFLPGYPNLWDSQEDREKEKVPGVLWHHQGKDTLLTNDTMRKAFYGWNELKKFPHVFPKAVDDVEAWRRAVPVLLDMLGQAVYDKEPIPDSLWNVEISFNKRDVQHVLAIRRSHKELEPFLDTLSWIFVLNPSVVSNYLDIIEQRAEEIGHILDNWPAAQGIDLVLQMIELEILDGSKRLDPLFELYATPDFPKIPLGDQSFSRKWCHLLEELPKRTKKIRRRDAPPKKLDIEIPERPTVDNSEILRSFIDDVAKQPTRDRRLTLELFDALIPSDIAARWKKWWTGTEPILQSAENQIDRMKQGIIENPDERTQRIKNLLRKWNEHVRTKPPKTSKETSIDAESLNIITNWNTFSWKPYWKQIEPLLKKLDREAGLFLWRLMLLQRLHNNIVTPSSWWEKIDNRTVLTALLHWQLPQHFFCLVIEKCWNGLTGTQEQLQRAGRMLQYWHVTLKQDEDLWDVIQIARFSEEESLLEQFLHVFARKEFRRKYIGDWVLQLATQTAKNEKEFAFLLKSLHSFEYESGNSDPEKILQLDKILLPSEVKTCFHKMLMQGKIKALSDIAEQIDFLHKNKKEIPVPEIDNTIEYSWVSQYPPRFDSSLRTLASLTPKAQQIAKRRLASLFYDAENLQQEIHSLKEILERKPDHPSRARIEKRIENFSKRLQAGKPQQITDVRLAHLQGKIEQDVDRLFFEKLRNGIRSVFESLIMEKVQIDFYPQSWTEPLHQKIVTGIFAIDLKSWCTQSHTFQMLGARILRHLCGVEKWDYLQEAANTAFLEKMKGYGVNVTPWIDPAPAERLDLDGCDEKEQLFLGIERDPMEIMKMGAAFQTCLSPGSENFFSTITNVLDVNKHILYVKNAKGAIRARCLIALSDRGELVAFCPYSHNPKMKFKDVVSEFLKRLAEQMKTVVVDFAVVSTLVAPEWYDDGSIPISEHFAFLKKGTVFHKKLETLSVSELVPELEKALVPLPLRSFIFKPFLNLPIVEKRPELLLPLLPLISHDLDTDDLLKTTQLVHQSGAVEKAKEILRRYLLRKFEKQFIDNRYIWRENVTKIAELMPFEILSHVRRLRSVVHFGDWHHEEQIQAMIAIYEKLGRKNRVRKLKERLKDFENDD